MISKTKTFLRILIHYRWQWIIGHNEENSSFDRLVSGFGSIMSADEINQTKY